MSSLEGIKLAVWDLDGTIIDSFGIFSAVVKEAAELAGRPVPADDHIRLNFHGSLDETIAAVFELAADEADVQILLNDFLRIQEDYYKNPDEHVFADSYALAGRLAIQNIPQVVVTNRAHEGRGVASPRYVIGNSRMQQYITDIVCGEDAPVRKPDAAVLDVVSVANGIAGNEILVIGDQFVDAQLAQNLGAQAAIVDREGRGVPHLNELQGDTSFMTTVNTLDRVY